MAGMEIEITVNHGQIDFLAEAQQVIQENEDLVVVNEPGACLPCRRNHDVFNVPCWECTGNILRIDPDDPGARNLCHCTVRSLRSDERTRFRADGRIT